jgi:DNA-binding SARP family transcriptional activator
VTEPGRAHLAARVLDAHPHGILVVARDGTVIAQNPAARALLGALGEELEGPGTRLPGVLLDAEHSIANGMSLVERALQGDEPLPDVRIELPPLSAARAAWVTVSPMPGEDDRVIVALRPGALNDRRRRTEPYWAHGRELRVGVLGRTRVESGEAAIGGRWLDNRTGQLLKYLVAARHRVVTADEIAESLWLQPDARKQQGVRYFVHALRRQLEPDRAPRAESSFIRSTAGGYALDTARVRVDADEFEAAVAAGRAAHERGDEDAATAWFTQASELYRGDFLADEPYAEWAMQERDRLHALATEALRSLTAAAWERGDLESAAPPLERLAELSPYDVDVHYALIHLCLCRHRRSEALRRYTSLRRRLATTFGEQLELTLADLTPAAGLGGELEMSPFGRHRAS